VLALSALVVLLSACVHDGRALRPPDPDQRQSILTTTTSSTVKASIGAPSTTGTVASTRLTLTLPWADSAAIDPAYTCKGAGTSPAVQWTGVPINAGELAVTVTDDDAQGFVHWVIAGLDPTTSGIAAGTVPTGAAQALNGGATVGWYGPCPPAGAKHRYRFTLYALSSPTGLVNGADTKTALAAVERNVLALDVVFGTFTA
jgi:Raf kinase inhibitor-like YbhB/YbcL family protein